MKKQSVGKIIKIIAIVHSICLLLVSAIAGIVLSSHSATEGLAAEILIGGIEVAIISGIFIYGIGEVIENVNDIRNKLCDDNDTCKEEKSAYKDEKSKDVKISKNNNAEIEILLEKMRKSKNDSGWKCSRCGVSNKEGLEKCSYCGMPRQ